MSSDKAKILAILAASLTAAACGKSSSDTATTTTTTGTSSATRTSTGAVTASSVDELGLTGSLAIALPDALSDSAGSLRLTGSKSMEACLMRESAKQLVQQVESATSLLCHIEAEGASIAWNTPTILDFSDMASAAARMRLDGPPTGDPGDLPPGGTPPTGEDPSSSGGEEPSFTIPMIGIYADDSDGDNVAVYVCQGESEDDMTLVQSFKITGSKSITKDGATLQVSKGLVNIAMGDDTMGTFKGAIGFDSFYTDPETSALKLEVKFGFTGFSFAQYFDLSAKDSGLTSVGISESGTMDFGDGNAFTFKNAGAGMFDAENGNVFYSYNGNGQDFSTQACVDSDSTVVDCASSTKFASGGDLYLETADIPAVLPATYSPAAPSGFDCSAATWTKVSPATDTATMAKHQACEGDASSGAPSADGDSGMNSCFTGYAQSTTTIDAEFEEGEPEIEIPELRLRHK